MSSSQPTQTPPIRRLGTWLAASALATAGLALAFQGGLLGLAGAGAGMLALAWAARHTASPAMTDEQREPAGRNGSTLMVGQVAPVWVRQLDATRHTSEHGVAAVLSSFSQISDALTELCSRLEDAQLAAAPGAIDEAVQGQRQALDELRAPSERAFAQRDAAVADVARCATALGELMQLAKQSREIARHTRLVAFNASIEAQRSSGDGGSQAVAVEVRALADRMADNGAQIERLVTELHAHMNTARRQGELSDTSAEELRLELDIRARDALQALLGGLGNALHGSTQVRQASHHLRNLVDEAVVDFQFGDRVSQMLNILGADMQRLAHWLSTHPHPTHEDASHWLAALERSYTMDEQRSQHHGNVHVERASVVEFF